MARLPYPDPQTLTPETREFLGKLPPLNNFRMMAGGEGLLRGFVRLGNHLLYRSKLDPILREIAIIRVGVLSNASYEVFQHERIGRGLGMTEPVLAAIRRGPDDPAFDDLQRLVVQFTDDVVRNVRASDHTFRPLAARLSICELQELTVAIGYYMAASRFLENFDIDIEAGADKPATPLGTPGPR
jgi:4-carboxymuconolactone decarboxylase